MCLQDTKQHNTVEPAMSGHPCDRGKVAFKHRWLLIEDLATRAKMTGLNEHLLPAGHLHPSIVHEDVHSLI